MHSIRSLRTALRPRRAPTGGRRSRGQSLVEFALVLPILLLLVLAAVDFGRVYLGYVNLQSLARIAANYAANNPTIDWTDGSNSKVQAYSRLILDDATATNCTLQQDGAGNNPPRPTYPTGTDLGDTAEVRLTCQFGLITPIIKNIFGGAGSIPVSAAAIFPVKSGGIAGIGVVGGGGPQIPLANFVGSPTAGTEPLTVVFTDQSTNAPTAWTWNFGDGNSSNDPSPTHMYTTAGTYTVSLTVTNADGSNTRTRSGYIAVNAPSAAEFSGTPTSGNAPLTVAFTDLSSGSPTGWAWTFGDGGTSTLQNPTHTYSAADTYEVTLAITGPGGPASQTKTAYIVVGIAQCVVPNVSDGATRKVAATSTLTGAGFVVATVGNNTNWFVRVQSPQGGLPVNCGSTVTIYQ